MKETKPYWYHDMAYSMEPFFVSLDFPNLLNGTEMTMNLKSPNTQHSGHMGQFFSN